MAWRALLNAPTFSAISVTVIALAIAPNLFIASVIASILLQPLPFPQPNALLFVQETNNGMSVNYPDAEKLASRAGKIAQISLAKFDAETLTGTGRAALLQGGIVSTNYFEVLGVQARIGRLFSANARRNDAVVISEGLWRSRFAGDAGVLGRRLRLNGREYDIAGVAPQRFEDPTPYGLIRRDYWLLIDPHVASQVSAHGYNYTCIARTSPDLAVAAQLRSILSSIVSDGAKSRPGFYVIEANSVQDRIVGPARPLLWILYAAAFLVLLLAFANIVNLQVARNAFRGGTLAIRAAVGATRGRLFSELAAEGLLLSIAGMLVGLALAWFGLRVVGEAASQAIPRWSEVTIGIPALLYAFLLVVCLTVLMAAIPAFASQRDLWTDLKTSRQTSARRANRTSTILVVTEISLATALVLSAALLLRSFIAILQVPVGFNPENAWVVSIPALSGPKYATPSQLAAYTSRVTEAVGAIPGVAAVSPAGQVPFLCCSSVGFSIPGRPQSPALKALYNPVGSQYFRTLGIPIVAGRLFDSRDGRSNALVAIVDEAFAKQFFAGTNVIGRRLGLSSDSKSFATIVGVVGGVRQDFVRPPRATLYVPAAQDPQPQMLVVRATRAATNLTADVDSAFDRIDPYVPAPTVYPYSDILAQHTLEVRLTLSLFATLAIIALCLALAGVYAIANHSMLQRRVEFGIRRAFGATSRRLLRETVLRTLITGVIGCGIGILLAECIFPVLSQMLYDTSPFDFVSLALVSLLIVATSVGAALPPAVRSISVDPASALRNE